MRPTAGQLKQSPTQPELGPQNSGEQATGSPDPRKTNSIKPTLGVFRGDGGWGEASSMTFPMPRQRASFVHTPKPLRGPCLNEQLPITVLESDGLFLCTLLCRGTTEVQGTDTHGRLVPPTPCRGDLLLQVSMTVDSVICGRATGQGRYVLVSKVQPPPHSDKPGSTI